MEQNFSSSIPDLTLEPELENTPKLVVAEETKLQQTKVAEPVLTPQEQQMVNDFAQKIDVENTAQILQYGAGTQKKMADFTLVLNRSPSAGLTYDNVRSPKCSAGFKRRLK